MQGEVYHVLRAGFDDNKPHPHVVVIEFLGTKDCLVVPAYSADGFAINQFIDAAKAQGYRGDQLCLQMDNAKHVIFVPPFTGHEAYWLTARFFRMSVNELKNHKRIGQMDQAGLSLIAEHLLILAESKPERFSAHVLKKLKQLLNKPTGGDCGTSRVT